MRQFIKSLTKKSSAFTFALILATVQLAPISLGATPKALATSDVCPNTGEGWTKYDNWPDEKKDQSHDAGAGKVVVEVCVKGGNDKLTYTTDTTDPEACWHVNGIGTQTATASENWPGDDKDSDCKDISHVSFKVADAPSTDPDYCDYAQVLSDTRSGSALARLRTLGFTGEDCFTVTPIVECGFANVTVVDTVRRGQTDWTYAAYHKFTDIVPPTLDTDGDSVPDSSPFPLVFPEDYNGGSVTVDWEIYGTENDYLADWQSSGSILVDTDCLDEKLTLKKHVLNNNGGSAEPDDWKLKAENNGQAVIDEAGTTMAAPYQNWASTSTVNVKAGVGYTLSEYGGPSGYQAGDWECTGGDGNELQGNVVTLENGENVTCYITNDDIAPKLTINKEIVGYDWNGPKDEDDFPLFVDLESVENGVAEEFMAGLHTIWELQQKGYELAGFEGDCDQFFSLPVATVNLNVGDNKACTIKNKAIPGTISVYKKVINDNGGHKVAKNFDLNIGYQHDVEQGEPHKLPVGTYKIWEDQEQGYKLQSVKCYTKKFHWASLQKLLGGDEWGWEKIAAGENKAYVELNLDEHVVCILVNNDIPPKITVKKVTDPSETSQQFNFWLEHEGMWDYPFTIGSGDSFTTNEHLKAGDTWVKEFVPEGWKLADVDCYVKPHYGWVWEKVKVYEHDGKYKFDTELGREYKCIFKNKQLGNVDVTKYNDLNGNGVRDEFFGEMEPTLEGFTINLDGHYSDSSEVTDDNGEAHFDNVYGGYTLSEDVPEGWELTNISCEYEQSEGYSSGHNKYRLYVGAGETVTCEIGNRSNDVNIDLEKTNNVVGSTGVETVVTYTLTLTNPVDSGILVSPTVTDTPPTGFSYVSGSWTASSNYRGDLKAAGVVPEPTTGTWTFDGAGDSEDVLYPGEVVTMTYQMKIAKSVVPGSHTNTAVAEGCASEPVILYRAELSNTLLDEIVDDPTECASDTADSTVKVKGVTIVLADTGSEAYVGILSGVSLLLAGLALASRREYAKKN